MHMCDIYTKYSIYMYQGTDLSGDVKGPSCILNHEYVKRSSNVRTERLHIIGRGGHILL